MPNTLAHIGLQVPLTRLGLKDAPLQWIALGCIIPDIPWIVQRVFHLVPTMDPIQLRVYVAIQASLLYCLALSAALAMLSRNSGRIFLILAINSLLHLLLDGAQTKWGNGVNLLLPFSWQLTNFGLFWPEHFLSYLLTGAGLLVLIFLWPKAIRSELQFAWPTRAKIMTMAICLAFYLGSPPLLFHFAYEADLHHSRTLSDRETRSGKSIEIDRGRYNGGQQTLTAYSGQRFTLSNPPAVDTNSLSIRGRFLDEDTIELSEFRPHKKHRDTAAIIGLLLTLLLWTHSLIVQRQQKTLAGNKQ